uniref:Small ribosomal subunit protein mS31 n=1 Tax=Heterorhabditis bacteriophora TaxID=37862 RepID=A0A1I7WW44_HETBA
MLRRITAFFQTHKVVRYMSCEGDDKGVILNDYLSDYQSRYERRGMVLLRKEIFYQAIQKGYKADDARIIAEKAVDQARERLADKRKSPFNEERKDTKDEIVKNKTERHFFNYAYQMADSEPSLMNSQKRLGLWNSLERCENSSLGFWTEWNRRAARFINQSMGPTNSFEEQIEWTKDGKQWVYPIDNEAMLGEEENVPFFEHIFLERHLPSLGLPKDGPIAHFMELIFAVLQYYGKLHRMRKDFFRILWIKLVPVICTYRMQVAMIPGQSPSTLSGSATPDSMSTPVSDDDRLRLSMEAWKRNSMLLSDRYKEARNRQLVVERADRDELRRKLDISVMEGKLNCNFLFFNIKNYCSIWFRHRDGAHETISRSMDELSRNATVHGRGHHSKTFSMNYLLLIFVYNFQMSQQQMTPSPMTPTPSYPSTCSAAPSTSMESSQSQYHSESAPPHFGPVSHSQFPSTDSTTFAVTVPSPSHMCPTSPNQQPSTPSSVVSPGFPAQVNGGPHSVQSVHSVHSAHSSNGNCNPPITPNSSVPPQQNTPFSSSNALGPPLSTSTPVTAAFVQNTGQASSSYNIPQQQSYPVYGQHDIVRNQINQQQMQPMQVIRNYFQFINVVSKKISMVSF